MMELFTFTIYVLFCVVVVITTAQLHSAKPELRFCTGSNPTFDVSKIFDGKNL